MIHNCLSCKKINYIFQTDIEIIGNAINSINYKEDICAYKCFECEQNNIIQTHVLNKDYSLNKLLWKNLNYELIEYEIPSRVNLKDIYKYKHSDVSFHNIYAEESKIIRSFYNTPLPEEIGVYIALSNKEDKRLSKLLIVTIYSSNLIETNRNIDNNSNKLIIAKK